MNIKDVVRYLVPEELFSIISIIYLICLNNLNKELELMNFNNAFELLAYKNYTPIVYFGVALLLSMLGAFIIFKRVNRFRYYDCSFVEVGLSFVGILLIIIILIQIWIFINNPIFRAILIAASAGMGLVGAQTGR